MDNNKLDCLLLCEKLISHIFTTFTSRKEKILDVVDDDFANYTFANLSMTSPEFWTRNIIIESKQMLDCEQSNDNGVKRVCSLEKSSGIHRHIAYVYVPSEIKKKLCSHNYFCLALQGSGALCMVGHYESDSKL